MAAAKKTAAKPAAPKAAPAAPVVAAAPAAPAVAPAPEAPAAAPAPAQISGDLATAIAAVTGAQPRDQEQAEAETVKPAEGEVFVFVRKGLERFHRCGMRFTREPTVLVIADLAEGVLGRLESEPSLEVVKG